MERSEAVTYVYDAGGSLTSFAGDKSGVRTAYLNLIHHDKFEQRTRLVLGNGIETNYAYDPASRRLDTLTSAGTRAGTFQNLQLELVLPDQTAEAVVAVCCRVDLGAVLARALGVRGDGADLFYGLAEAAVVEFLAAGGVFNPDKAADLVGAVAFALIFKERCCVYSEYFGFKTVVFPYCCVDAARRRRGSRRSAAENGV